MTIPYWIKLSIMIGCSIVFGTWFAGETTRKMDTDYFLATIHDDMQRTTTLLAGLIAVPVATGDIEKTTAIIKQYVSGWSEFTYVHVLNDKGEFVTEWKKEPRLFGEGVRKFEQTITYGGQQFGILSVYANMISYQTEVDRHVNQSRRQSSLVLLAITMFMVFFVNFFAVKDMRSSSRDE